MEALVTPEQRKLIATIKDTLMRLTRLLAKLGLTEEERSLLSKANEQLEQCFLLVIVGEFNSGKSQMVNALLGQTHCKIGALPTTEVVHILRYGEEHQVVTESDNVHSLYLPIPWLRTTNLVDTPGTNAVLTKHQEITEHFVPRSDLVLFVTSFDRPFSESERQFLQRIYQWKKKVVLVLNKKDLLPDGQNEVINFVINNGKQVLHEEPKVFAVSSRDAMTAKSQLAMRDGSSDSPSNEELERLFKESGFGDLENYIRTILSGDNKLRFKLKNPLGIANNLQQHYYVVLQAQLGVLEEDNEVLKTVRGEMDEFENDLRQDFANQLMRLDNIFLKMLDKTDKFLSENLRLSKTPKLLQADDLKKKFDQEVNAGVSEEVHECVQSVLTWIQDKSNRQSTSVARYLNTRQLKRFGGQSTMLDPISLQFDDHRSKLINKLQRETRDIISPADRQKGVEDLNDQVRSALMLTAAVELGAVGLGALFTTALFDWTGLAGASVVALTGLYVMPYRRGQLKNDMRTSIQGLQKNMREIMQNHFEKELVVSLDKINNCLEPYERFIRTENAKFVAYDTELASLASELDHIQSEINRTMPACDTAATVNSENTAKVGSTDAIHAP